jgi:hypothetical protein
MATEFKILRGSKATLIDNDGVVLIPENKLVNGYWYLTNDTAEVFVCLEIDGHLTLKKINECLDTSEVEWDEFRIEDIENRLTALETQGSDVLTCASFETFPATGRSNTLYVDTATQKSYIWLNTEYVPVSGSEYVEPAIIFGGTAD